MRLKGKIATRKVISAAMVVNTRPHTIYVLSAGVPRGDTPGEGDGEGGPDGYRGGTAGTGGQGGVGRGPTSAGVAGSVSGGVSTGRGGSSATGTGVGSGGAVGATPKPPKGATCAF